jgi:hypothetical protein
MRTRHRIPEGLPAMIGRACLLIIMATIGMIMATIGLAGAHPPAARQETKPDLQTVLGRAADYATDYLEKLSSIVAEERYVQRTLPETTNRPLLPGPRVEERERVLRSDFVIVRGFDAGSPWLGVREVLEVDGHAVEGEHGRLEALLSGSDVDTASRLRALADAQARYNLGDLYRTINVPTMPLEFLLRDRQDRFRFKRAGTAELHGVAVWTITFRERVRPTLIRTPEGRDVVSAGVFWVEPGSGAVLRSELRAGENLGRRLRSLILVSYARNARFDMLLPDDMNELYVTGHTRIEGHATYGRFRRFETDVRIK